MSRLQNLQRTGVAAISEPKLSAHAGEQRRLPPAYGGKPHGRVGEQPMSPEQQGWDAYRKWLSRVAAQPTPERPRLDRSVYSWRGYHTWADKVRRSWDDGKA
jgi:hypothetical protein